MMKPTCTNAKTVQRTMNTLYKGISKPFSFRLVPGSSLFCQKEISLPRTLPIFSIPPPPPPTQKDAIFSKKLAPVLQAKILTRNTFIAKSHEAVRASRMNLESRIQYCFGQYLTWVCWKITEERGSTLDLSGGENSSARWDALTNILLSPVCAQLPGRPSPSKKIKGEGNSILKLSQTPTGHPREKL